MIAYYYLYIAFNFYYKDVNRSNNIMDDEVTKQNIASIRLCTRKVSRRRC